MDKKIKLQITSKANKLCKKCYNWISSEDDINFNDIPHCLYSGDYDVRKYLYRTSKNCPNFLEY